MVISVFSGYANYCNVNITLGKPAMIKLLRVSLLVFLIGQIGGCALERKQIGDDLGLWSPRKIEPIHSVEYYETKDGVDLSKFNHDIRKEYTARDRLNRDTARNAKTILNQITVGNRKLGADVSDKNLKYRLKFLLAAKKNGPNDYYVGCRKACSIEKQEGDNLCWAACIQSVIYYIHNKKVKQSDLAKFMFKNGKDYDYPASASEILSAFGFTDSLISINGGDHLLDSLAYDYPVLLGVTEPNQEFGHFVLVIGARFSFVEDRPINIPWVGGGIPIKSGYEMCDVAFREFVVLDPGDGLKKTLYVHDIENRITTVMSVVDVAGADLHTR